MLGTGNQRHQRRPGAAEGRLQVGDLVLWREEAKTAIIRGDAQSRRAVQ